MKLIDDAKSRSARQRIPDNVLRDIESGDFHSEPTQNSKEVLLDALGNVPIKLYDVGIGDIDDIVSASWAPRLHLTDEERHVVEAKGTTLLLGRSGTGKTLCICNRMEFDRIMFSGNIMFTQLFVSRSARLCRYVSGVVGGNDSYEFMTLQELVNMLDTSLPQLNSSFASHLPSQHVSFVRFRREL